MLSEQKRKRILQLHAKGASYREVAQKLKISFKTVGNVVNKVNHCTGRTLGRPKAITTRQSTRIKKFIRSEIQQNHTVNSADVMSYMDLKCSKRTVRRKILDLGFHYAEVPKNLPLQHYHKTARFQFARKHLEESTDFKRVIFTDEKRFKKDGPDGLMSYCDPKISKTAPVRIKRQNGGGGVMVLGAICANGKVS